MQREAVGLADGGAKKEQLMSYRWLGTIIPKVYGYDERTRRIVQLLQNSVFNVDLSALEHGDPSDSSKPQTISAPLGLVSYSVEPGESLSADVVIQNKGVVHSHVPEQRYMYESWVNFTVKDAVGKVLTESGFLKPSGDLDEYVHSFL
jgi:hypothetical protein